MMETSFRIRTTACGDLRLLDTDEPRSDYLMLMDFFSKFNKDVMQHGIRVSVLMSTLLPHISIGGDDAKNLIGSGIFHDIGKIAVPDAIVYKPGALEPDEWAQIKMHPLIGSCMIKKIFDCVFIEETIAQHHERWDGKGYPYGLRGNEIPLGSRLLSICDSVDAMTTDRTYRRSRTKTECIDELINNAGTQFDPQLVDLVVSKLKHYYETL